MFVQATVSDIEPVNRELSKLVGGWAEVVVIVQNPLLAKYPVSTRLISLYRASLDYLSEIVLALVCKRKHVLLQQKGSTTDCHTQDEDRYRQSVDTDSTGLHGYDLVRLFQ